MKQTLCDRCKDIADKYNNISLLWVHTAADGQKYPDWGDAPVDLCDTCAMQIAQLTVDWYKKRR